jgi:integrase
MAGAYIRKRERKDGVVYVASVDLGRDPITGKRRERSETFKTKREAKAALARWQTEIERGTFVDRSTQTVADLLRYWLETSVKHNRSQNTYVNYRYHVNGHLIPALGHIQVQKLTVAQVQQFYADKIEGGAGRRTVELCHLCLHRALDMAVHLGVVGRNVTDAVQAPKTSREERRAWSREEVRRFLAVARESHYGPVWLLMATTGMRRGEVLGLRWQDIDLHAGTFSIRQQLQRVGGSLRTGPVKTRAGNRDLPIPGLAREALLIRQQKQAADREAFGRAWQDTGLVFTTRSGLPIEPRNLVRSFRRICDSNQIRVIKVHHLRHTTASLLKKLRVAPRDAQMILGHAHISTTMQIYTHVDQEARDDALASLNKLLGGTSDVGIAVNNGGQRPDPPS